MRELKFRGKRIDNGEWAYGSYVRYDFHNSIDYVENSQIVALNAHAFDVDPETVGQYTGLKDKNGKEIYEGDILERQGHFSVQLVYDKGMRVVDTEKVRFNNKCLYAHIYEFDFSGWEIAGNIHSNPEPLNQTT